MQKEKIENFQNLSSLINKLKEEIESKDFARFPVRFILVEDSSNWGELIKFLNSFVNTTIHLSEYCSAEDTYPDLNRGILDAIELSKEGKRVLLVPLSEVFRIGSLDEITAKICRLVEFQADPTKNGRLYVPLYCFKGQFIEIWGEYFDQIRLYPPLILQSEQEKVVNIWVVKEKEFLRWYSNLPIRSGFRALLKMWEIGNIPEHLLTYSHLLYNLAPKVTGKVNISRIENYKDFLDKLLAIDVPISYLEEENKFWRELIRLFLSYKCNAFEELVKKKLNVIRFSKEIFYRWKDLNDIDKWLLFYWGKTEIRDKNTYLYYVLNDSNNFSDFEKMLWLSILNIENIETNLLKERIDLITKVESSPPVEFLSEIKEIVDPVRKITILSGTSEIERVEAIKCLSRYLKDVESSEIEIFEFIKIIFPELYYYLTIPPLENEKLSEYLKEYIYAKVCNQLTEKLRKLSGDMVKDNIVLYFPTRNSIIEKYSNYPQVWIDGLGIEWIGLLYGLLRAKYRDCSISFEITRANLPTTTEFNTIPKSIEVKEFCLDHIYHSYNYKFPESMLKEFECIKSILEKIDFILQTSNKVVITSDHGSTRFSGWTDEKITKPNGAEVERYGRYVISSNKPKDLTSEYSEYYMEKHNGKYFLMSKSHKNFDGGKKVHGENHGGATVEEALIPVITISKVEDVELKIEIESDRLPLLKPILRTKVHPPVDRVQLRILNRVIIGRQVDNENWEFNLKSLKLNPGKYTVIFDLPIGSEEKIITIKGGMEEEELL